MSDAVWAAAVGATPPTLAALLAFATARAARREAAKDRTAALAGQVEAMGGALRRTAFGVERLEAGVGELRERVARIEGHLESWAERP